ncbi:MAG: H/ACA RNA-protein complex protein Gar1 [Hadesarchaea archaeon]|nr:H/ACA RNA-protein complex protein Gar1 [Hadesarchaea archaeon]
MSRLGEVLHLSDQNLVVKAEQVPEIGTSIRIESEKTTFSGEVVDIFGPKEQPYVAVKLSQELDNPTTLIGLEVLLED